MENTNYSKELLKKFPCKRDFTNNKPEIKICKSIKCAYIRHTGYNKSIKNTWEKLTAIAYEKNLKNYKELALYKYLNLYVLYLT